MFVIETVNSAGQGEEHEWLVTKMASEREILGWH